MQLKLQFPLSKPDNYYLFSFSFKYDNKLVFIHRNKHETTVNIKSVNQLGKPIETIFTFCNIPFINKSPNKIYLPDLHFLTKYELITFAKNVINRHNKGLLYKWNIKTQTNIYQKENI